MAFKNFLTMKIVFLICLVWGMSSPSVRSEPSEKAIDEASQSFLKTVVRAFSHSPEASSFLAGASTDNVSLQRCAPLVNSPDGWAYVWHYEHDVTYVENAQSQSGRSVVFGNGAPIIFDIWVVYKFGTGKLFPWNKRYHVLETPKLETGFGLDTKNNEIQKRLVQKTDRLMKDNIPTFRKTLDSH